MPKTYTATQESVAQKALAAIAHISKELDKTDPPCMPPGDDRDLLGAHIVGPFDTWLETIKGGAAWNDQLLDKLHENHEELIDTLHNITIPDGAFKEAVYQTRDLIWAVIAALE